MKYIVIFALICLTNTFAKAPDECLIDEDVLMRFYCSHGKKYKTYKVSGRTEFIGRCECKIPPKPEPKKPSPQHHDPKKSSPSHDDKRR